MGAKGKPTKKKGPKGKKARAKAKLDQVWGEHVDQEDRDANKVRVGKSRFGVGVGGGSGGNKERRQGKKEVDPLYERRRGVPTPFDKFLKRKEQITTNNNNNINGAGYYQQQQKQKKKQYQVTQTVDSSEEDTDSDEEMDSNGNGGASYATLLQRIGNTNGNGTKKKKKSSSTSSRMDLDSEDDESESDDNVSSSDESSDEESTVSEEQEESTEDNKSDDEESLSDDDEQEVQDNNGQGSNKQSTTIKVVVDVVDPYDAHFANNKPTLPQLQDSLQPQPPPPSSSTTTSSTTTSLLVPYKVPTNNRKVPTHGILNSASNIEVQLSGPLLDTFDAITAANTSTNTTTANGNPASSDGKKNKANKNKRANNKKVWKEFASGPLQYNREVLTRHWKSSGNNKTVLKKRGDDSSGKEEDETSSMEKLQLAMYPGLARYADTLITCDSRQNRNEINNLLSLHILNHVLTSRSRVQRHNRRIKELTTKNNGDNTANADNDAKGCNNNEEEEEEGGDKWRDQGYTRPKVLILLPTRGSAYTFIQQMLLLLDESAIVDNGDRFEEEYGPLLDDDSNDGEEGSDEEEEQDNNAKEAKKKQRRAAVLKQKGYEWNDLFGDEINSDDDFKMGLSLTPNVVKKKSGGGGENGKKSKGKNKSAKHSGGASGVHVKLFADYYHSDIILASPIGLKMVITGDDEEDDGADNNAAGPEGVADKDFLSSIDICLVGRSDVLLMQNWDHVNTILESINQQPTKIADIDFSRVRNYFLEGQAAHWRQLIVVSQFTDPYILSTFRRHAKNVEGQCKVRHAVSNDEDASICNVMVRRVRQVFQRVACTSISEAGSNRLRYFSEHVLSKLMRLDQKHTMIYIPNYFDFIAVRNLLLKKEASFVSVTEYARVSEVSRGRARFLQGRKNIMLYTGRAHFFLRHVIKGARQVIFFGLPEYAEFYPDVVNMLNGGLLEGRSSIEGGDEDVTRMPMSCLSLFTKFDAHQLERIVGTSHTERMIRGEKSSFMFSS